MALNYSLRNQCMGTFFSQLQTPSHGAVTILRTVGNNRKALPLCFSFSGPGPCDLVSDCFYLVEKTHLSAPSTLGCYLLALLMPFLGLQIYIPPKDPLHGDSTWGILTPNFLCLEASSLPSGNLCEDPNPQEHSVTVSSQALLTSLL